MKTKIEIYDRAVSALRNIQQYVSPKELNEAHDSIAKILLDDNYNSITDCSKIQNILTDLLKQINTKPNQTVEKQGFYNLIHTICN